MKNFLRWILSRSSLFQQVEMYYLLMIPLTFVAMVSYMGLLVNSAGTPPVPLLCQISRPFQ